MYYYIMICFPRWPVANKHMPKYYSFIKNIKSFKLQVDYYNENQNKKYFVFNYSFVCFFSISIHT